MPELDRMTARARIYLAILGLRHLLIGLFAIADPNSFETRSFDAIKAVLSLQGWGVLFVIIGVYSLVFGAVGDPRWARWILTASVACTAAWAAGFMGAALAGGLFAPIAPIIWASLVGKDLVMAASPIRTPFEKVAEVIVSTARVEETAGSRHFRRQVEDTGGS